MPRYSPIDAGVPLKASLSDLASLHWSTNGIVADFVLPDDEAHLLRVSFDRQCIIRILDEMPLSTEEDDTPNEGLVSEHFAYRLEVRCFRPPSVRCLEGSERACIPLSVRHRLGLSGRSHGCHSGVRRRAKVAARAKQN
jgi:hypothetical protein